MKIYNKIVLDKDNNIIEEDHFEYNGPISYCGGGGGSSSDGSAGSVTQETEDFSQQPTDYGVNMGGPAADYDDSFATDYSYDDSQTSDEQMTSDPGYTEYSPTTNIEDIHGEHTDPGSGSYDPTYNPAYQARQTREQVFGTGEGAGESKWNPETQSMERVTNKTFKEHWDDTPESIKYSPTLRFLYASGKNVGEWATNKNWNVSSNNNFDGGSGGDNESQMMKDVAPAAPYIVSGTTQPTNSPAANWYQGLGNNTLSGSNTFNMATEYAAAKAKQKSILGSPTPIGQLAVNDSPFYNWLKERGLNKGIL
jgi:hypothetical protein